MSQSEPLFMTQRRKVVEAYKQAGEPFSASTKPYKSTVSYTYTQANEIVAASVSWLIARAGQSFEWFSYKIGDGVPGNAQLAAGYRGATEADTNISKARTTNGAEDFVIEGMSASHRNLRATWFDGPVSLPTDLVDPDVVSAAKGGAPLLDPAALYLPPQAQSPFNLENVLYRALAPHISIEFEWDRSKTVKIGTLEQLPEGAANSYLRALGEPSTNDRYRIPEGYLWRREGQPDSEFVTRGALAEPVLVPILNIQTPTSTTSVVHPVGKILLDIVVRLHGLSVKLPTRN